MVSLLAANQDPETNTHADTFDPDRPARHLSFGTGIHYCLGARLARTEATAAISSLLQRFPQMKLATESTELRWRRSLFFRRLETFPSRWQLIHKLVNQLNIEHEHKRRSPADERSSETEPLPPTPARFDFAAQSC